MMGGLGSLGGLTGLSIVPFGGRRKKRRRRRRRSTSFNIDDRDEDVEFDDNYDFYDKQQILRMELIFGRFYKFLNEFEFK